MSELKEGGEEENWRKKKLKKLKEMETYNWWFTGTAMKEAKKNEKVKWKKWRVFIWSFCFFLCQTEIRKSRSSKTGCQTGITKRSHNGIWRCFWVWKTSIGGNLKWWNESWDILVWVLSGSFRFQFRLSDHFHCISKWKKEWKWITNQWMQSKLFGDWRCFRKHLASFARTSSSSSPLSLAAIHLQ